MPAAFSRTIPSDGLTPGKTPASGDLGVGQSGALTLSLSEKATVKGTPTLTLDDGGVATYFEREIDGDVARIHL